jgi:hypothetical protein
MFASSSTRKLRVVWFDKWEEILNDAVKGLPEHPQWSNELLEILFERTTAESKKIALVTDQGLPVAIVGLRSSDGKTYEPVANAFTIPQFHLIGQIDSTASILMNIDVPLSISWWRMPSEPPMPTLRNVRSYVTKQHYIADLSEDPEVYWRASGHLNTVRRMRNRCQQYEIKVNPVGGEEWVTANWGRHWVVDPRNVNDRIFSAQCLRKLGKYLTIVMYDGERPVAGNTYLEHNGSLVWLVTYRDEGYEQFGVGTRLMDYSFQYAKQSGFRNLDLGTTQSYKLRWAPLSDQQWVKFELCPEYQYRLMQFRRYGNRIRRLLNRT